MGVDVVDIEDKRIAVLLSGGVDSSAMVHELTQMGLHPDCFYVKIGPEEAEEWDCSSEEDLEMATAVAAKYGCRLQVADCHKKYQSEVTKYTTERVKAGYIPNPDVMCNQLIKFGTFDAKVGHQYDLITTGHYAQTEVIGGKKWLVIGPDPVKDQTNFLAQIYDWQFKKALFPIGHYQKNEVCEITEHEHLVSAKRRDSQGICFLGQIDHNKYLCHYLGEKHDDVIELETGKKIGEHRGLWFHIIGQRHGLGSGGGPQSVVKKDVQANVLYVSRGYDPKTTCKSNFRIHDFHFLTEPLDMEHIIFKIKHTPEYHPTTIKKTAEGCYIVHAAQPIYGVASRQFCVVYDGQHHRCIGSAEITAQGKIACVFPSWHMAFCSSVPITLTLETNSINFRG